VRAVVSQGRAVSPFHGEGGELSQQITFLPVWLGAVSALALTMGAAAQTPRDGGAGGYSGGVAPGTSGADGETYVGANGVGSTL